MVKYNHQLESQFQALGQSSRQLIIKHIATHCRCSTTELAKELNISLPAVKHLAVLEKSGLIVGTKEGRTNWFSLNQTGLDHMIEWLLVQQRFWHQSFDRLDAHLNKNIK
jgi:predicted transcriptional regulator